MMHILLKLAERLREVDQSFKILQMPPTSMLDRMIFTTSSAGGASWENWTKQVSKLPLWYPGIRCRLVAAWPKRASTQSLQKATGSLCKPPKKRHGLHRTGGDLHIVLAETSTWCQPSFSIVSFKAVEQAWWTAAIAAYIDLYYSNLRWFDGFKICIIHGNPTWKKSRGRSSVDGRHLASNDHLQEEGHLWAPNGLLGHWWHDVLPKYAIDPPKPKKVTNQKKSHKLEKPYYSICDFFLAYFGSTRIYIYILCILYV